MLERLLHFIGLYPLDFVSYFSSSLPIVIGYFRILSLIGNLRIIWYLFFFFFIKDTYALIHMFLIPNILYVQNLEAIFETIIIGIIFLTSFNKHIHKKLIIVFTVICSIVEIVFYKSTNISSASLSIFRFFSIVLSLSYFNNILTDMRVKAITKHSMFWFTSGLFIYTAGTFFIFLFSEYIYDPEKTPAELFDKFWNISQVLFITFCLLSANGLWVSKYEKENVM